MVKLKRTLGLFDITMYGVGIILGAGIYVLIGKAAGISGNSIWLAFVLSGIVAGLTGLSYAELSGMFPRSAAEYVYTKKAFGNRVFSFLVGWLSACAIVIAAAAVALGFGSYASADFGVPVVAAAIAVIAVCSLINFWGIKESSNLNIIFTSIEIIGLLLIIFLSIPKLGSVDYFEMPAGFSGIAGAAILVFFAFLGFEDLVNIPQETKSPRRTIPHGLLLAIAISTILYVIVSISVVSLLDWQKLGESKAPLAEAAAASGAPWAGGLLSYIALFATFNTVLFLLIAGSRKIFGMAEEHEFVRQLTYVHPSRKTPLITIVLIGLASIGFTLIGDIKKVAELTDFAAFALFAAVNASVIILRYAKPHYPREFSVPLSIGKMPVIPLLGLLFCIYMLSFFKPEIYFGILAVIAAGIFILAITYNRNRSPS